MAAHLPGTAPHSGRGGAGSGLSGGASHAARRPRGAGWWPSSAARRGARAAPLAGGGAPEEPQKALDLFELLARTAPPGRTPSRCCCRSENLHYDAAAAEALQYIVRRLGASRTLVVATWRQRPRRAKPSAGPSAARFRRRPRCAQLQLSAAPGRRLPRPALALAGGGAAARRAGRQAAGDHRRQSAFHPRDRRLVAPRAASCGPTKAAGFRCATRAAPCRRCRPPCSRRWLSASPTSRRSCAGCSRWRRCLGRSFSEKALANLLEEGAGAAGLGETIDALLQQGLLQEERAARQELLRFAHGVVHDVLYLEIPRRRRRRLHRRHAECLEERHARQARAGPSAAAGALVGRRGGRQVRDLRRAGGRPRPGLVQPAGGDRGEPARPRAGRRRRHRRRACPNGPSCWPSWPAPTAPRASRRPPSCGPSRRPSFSPSSASPARRPRRRRSPPTSPGRHGAPKPPNAGWPAASNGRAPCLGKPAAGREAKAAARNEAFEDLLRLAATTAGLRGERERSLALLTELETLQKAGAGSDWPLAGEIVAAMASDVAGLDPGNLETDEASRSPPWSTKRWPSSTPKATCRRGWQPAGRRWGEPHLRGRAAERSAVFGRQSGAGGRRARLDAAGGLAVGRRQPGARLLPGSERHRGLPGRYLDRGRRHRGGRAA